MRERPERFTCNEGTYESANLTRGRLQEMPRDEVRAIAKFMYRHWNVQEFGLAWIGQEATKPDMIEFIVTGYRPSSNPEPAVLAVNPTANLVASQEPAEPEPVQPELYRDDEPSYVKPKSVIPEPRPLEDSIHMDGLNAGSNGQPEPDDLADILAKALEGRIHSKGNVSPEQLEKAIGEKLDGVLKYVDNESAKVANQAQEALFAERERVDNRLSEIASDLASRAGGLCSTVTIQIVNHDDIVLDDNRHMAFDDLFLDCKAMVANGETERANFWLVGPAGTGKTTAAKMIAEKLGLAFYTNGAIDSEYKLRGFIDAQGRVIHTPFRRAYMSGGVYLFDEVDSSLPSACLAFNAALANGCYDFPKDSSDLEQLTTPRHPECIILAASNTWGGPDGGYVGRFRQDAAFMDRFMRIPWETDERLERSLCRNTGWVDYCQSVRARVIANGVEHIVSPRCTLNGDRLLSAGRPWQRVVDICLRKGLDSADWNKISGGQF